MSAPRFQRRERVGAIQKSIFTRYLGITMGIVVLSFIMLGTVMMAFFAQYWRGEKKDLLLKNANSIADVSSVFLTKSGEDSYQLETNVLKGFIATFSTSIDADIFITDLEGNILLGNYANSKLTDPQTVPKQTVAAAAQSGYEGRGTFGGLYQSPSYIIGVPMYTSEGQCVGTVFAATSAASVNAFEGEALQMFLVAGGCGLGHHLLRGGGVRIPAGKAPAADERCRPQLWQRGFFRAGACHQLRRAGPAGGLLQQYGQLPLQLRGDPPPALSPTSATS